MKYLATGLVLVCTLGAINPSVATSPDRQPDYCTGFSYDACSRIRSTIETGIRPPYCAPGFGLVGSGLTPEQQRICYAQPLDAAELKEERAWNDREAAWQAAQKQKIEDARAMVRESWAGYGDLIERIETGYKCGVLEQLPSNVAVQRLQGVMESEKDRAGLIGDTTMSVQDFTATRVRVGKCSRLTLSAAMRGFIAGLSSN